MLVIQLLCDDTPNVFHVLVYYVYTAQLVHITEQGLLAEDKGKVVFGLLLTSQVFETQSLQQAQQTLVIYRELSP